LKTSITYITYRSHGGNTDVTHDLKGIREKKSTIRKVAENSSLQFDLPALRRRVFSGSILRGKKYILREGNYGNFGCEANSEVGTWTA
jgi:hypothetical protein